MQVDGVERMVMREREMDGWLLVEPAAWPPTPIWPPWVERGVAAAQSAS